MGQKPTQNTKSHYCKKRFLDFAQAQLGCFVQTGVKLVQSFSFPTSHWVTRLDNPDRFCSCPTKIVRFQGSVSILYQRALIPKIYHRVAKYRYYTGSDLFTRKKSSKDFESSLQLRSREGALTRFVDLLVLIVIPVLDMLKEQHLEENKFPDVNCPILPPMYRPIRFGPRNYHLVVANHSSLFCYHQIDVSLYYFFL